MEISRSRYLENEGFLIVSCNNFYNNRVLKRLWNNIVHGNERHNEGRYFYIQVCNLQLLIGDASSDCFCFVWFIVAAFVASFDALNHPLPPSSFLFFFFTVTRSKIFLARRKIYNILTSFLICVSNLKNFILQYVLVRCKISIEFR